MSKCASCPYIEKDENGKRKVNVDGQPFRVSLTFKETISEKTGNPLYAYSLDKIELLGDTSKEENSNNGLLYAPNSYVSGAKRLKGVEKSYDSGKLLLDESKDSGNRFSKITHKQDVEYIQAVEEGEMEKAGLMVRDAFKAAFPDTKVVDEKGGPLCSYSL